MARGTYLFSYRVTSLDSHPVSGSIVFSVGEVAAPSRSAVPLAAAGFPATASIVLRALRDMALLAAAGAALFVLCVTPFQGQRRVLATAGIAAAALSVLCIGVHGALLEGSADVLAPHAWGTSLRTSFGVSSLLAAAGSACLAWASTFGGARARTLLLGLGALACVASLPLTGHAAAAQPRWLAGAAIGVHGLAAAFWFGSLLALHVLLRRDVTQALPALQRFSRLGAGGVAVLLAAGVGFAALQLHSLADLTQSSYGRLMLLKAALLAALIALAAINRFVLMPRLSRGAGDALAKLRRTIAAEIAMVIAVLAATAVLVQTPPHRGPLSRSLEAGGRHATLTLDPGRAGRNAITAVLADAQGRALDVAAVEIDLSNPGAGIEPMRRTMQRVAAGRYQHEGGELAFAGTWQLEIRARIDDFERVSWSTRLDLR